MTRARQRLYLSHAWQRATRRGPGTSFMAEPSRFLLEIPQDLMSGPRLGARTEDGEALRHARRPEPRVRARGDAVRAADSPGRRRVSRGQRAPGSAAGRRAVPAVARPRGATRRVRRRGAVGHVRASFAARRAEPAVGRRARWRDEVGAATDGRAGAPSRGRRRVDRSPGHPGRAPLPRRRPRAPRALGRRHRRQLEAHAQRRGGHDRLPRPADRAQDAARLAGRPRADRLARGRERLPTAPRYAPRR